MMTRIARFNFILCGAVAVLLAAGCESSSSDKNDKEDKHPDKDATSIQLHMEVEADGIQDNGPVEVGRDHPIIVNVDKEPFMDGEFLDSAELLDDAGGLFEIRLKFNWQGSALLNQQTSSFPGKRVAVYCAFGHGQSKNFYIASPKIDRPILNGVLTFTPAVTHDEAERIVRGLNNVSKALKKDNAFP